MQRLKSIGFQRHIFLTSFSERSRNLFTKCNLCFKKNDADNGSSGSKKGGDKSTEIPEEPTTCCMSGCANCVWVVYAQKLSEIFNDGGEKSREIILSRVTDPNMKAFLSMELSIMAMKAKQAVKEKKDDKQTKGKEKDDE